MSGSNNNMNGSNQAIQLVESKKFTPTELLFKYLSYLPLFVISLAVCFSIGYFYARYKKPLYKSSIKMYVKAEGQGSSRAGGDIIDAAMFGGPRVNIENEIELIKTSRLLNRVAATNDFNVLYYKEGNIRSDNIHNGAPFKVVFLQVPDSSASFSLLVESVNARGASVSIFNGEKAENKGKPVLWNKTVNLNGWQFKLLPSAATDKGSFIVRWQPVSETAANIGGALTIRALSAKTSIISLEMVSDNANRGADILDAIVEEYKQLNIEEKNKVAISTINFINQRLDSVSGDLTGVETNLLGFKNRQQIFDVQTQYEQLVERTGTADKALIELQIKQRVASMLEQYLASSANQNNLVPSNMGIEDPVLAGLVAKYNELILKREREAGQLAPGSMLLADMNDQVAEVRQSILENLRNYKRTTALQLNDERSRKIKAEGTLRQMPANERTLKEIGRQQAVKEGLYLYLLQKREETAITSSATTSSYRAVDDAVGYATPIEPNTGKIRMISILIGLLIPIAFIYIRDLLNDKVTTKEDVTRKTDAPFAGDVGHDKSGNAMVVANQGRSIVAEQFRIIRSNLEYFLKDGKVVLITSSISGEGKSFVSLNLASVLALSGKKVALLEFDLRRPRIFKNIGFETLPGGISNYLIGQPIPLDKMYGQAPEIPSLHIFPCGPVPPNPSELLLGDKLHELFTELRKLYDYVIIDSAPVGLVSDSFTLSKFADCTLYVIRQRYTLKKQVDYINDLYVSKKLPNVGLVLNDVKVGGRYGYYGYGNGYGYGYNGSAYGAYFDDDDKKKPFFSFGKKKNQ